MEYDSHKIKAKATETLKNIWICYEISPKEKVLVFIRYFFDFHKASCEKFIDNTKKKLQTTNVEIIDRVIHSYIHRRFEYPPILRSKKDFHSWLQWFIIRSYDFQKRCLLQYFLKMSYENLSRRIISVDKHIWCVILIHPEKSAHGIFFCKACDTKKAQQY